MITNERLVAQARSWIGTQFAHQGRVKKTANHKGGVDCLGLLVGIASELGLCTQDGKLLGSLDSTDYSHYPDTELLQESLESVLTRVPLGGICSGHILLLQIDGQPQHLAVVADSSEGLRIIHAYAPARAVVEHALDEYWQQRIVAVYAFL